MNLNPASWYKSITQVLDDCLYFGSRSAGGVSNVDNVESAFQVIWKGFLHVVLYEVDAGRIGCRREESRIVVQANQFRVCSDLGFQDTQYSPNDMALISILIVRASGTALLTICAPNIQDFHGLSGKFDWSVQDLPFKLLQVPFVLLCQQLEHHCYLFGRCWGWHNWSVSEERTKMGG